MLKRVISFPLLLLYGLGTTVGAGIYALMGPVAGHAGSAAPFAFLVASLLAGLTAVSFAALSARFPRSAGEAVYFREAFGHRAGASVIGLAVALSGCVSAATISRAFAGYLTGVVDLPVGLCVVSGVGVLTATALWGIRESLWVAALVTVIEVAGLLLVMWAARDSLAELPMRAGELLPTAAGASWPGIFAGGLLAFYAFLGFEDMVNVAEEVKDVGRTLPWAIVVTLLLTTSIYVLVAAVSVLTVPPEVLRESEEPLALVYRTATGTDSALLSGVAILAMMNGAMIQIVMASRVLYGLAGEPFVPRAIGHVHSRFRTPDRATLLVGGLILALALYFPIEPLAAAASSITLVVFSAVNASLAWLLFRDPTMRASTRIPIGVPLLGLLSNLAFLGYSAWVRLVP
ncbi:MAG: amino acid permease [Deltaproteobacteria bacterium]|jgi:amino acid transporter|nr:amino acid permease [Deltaproteobacteria bacterium]